MASRPRPSRRRSAASAICGIRMNEPNMPKPTSSVAMFGDQHRRTGERVRCRPAARRGGARRRRSRPARRARRDQPERAGRRPAPVVRAARSRSAAPRPTASDRRRRGVDAPRRADRRLGHEADRRRRSPRRPSPRRARRSSGSSRWSTSRPPSGRPDRRRRCPRRAEIRPMPVGTRSRGNSSRMIAEAEREDAAADALQHAAGDHQAERCRRARETTEPAANSAERDRQQALLAEHVARGGRTSAWRPTRPRK